MSISYSKLRRLCLASPLFFPTYGGSQLRFLNYLPGLRKRGLDIQVLTGTPPRNEISSAQGTGTWDSVDIGRPLPEEEVFGTPVHRVRLPEKKGWRRTAIYNRALLHHCQNPEYRPDVLQMVGTLKPQSIQLLRKLKLLGMPLLYAVTVAPKSNAVNRWWDIRQRGELKLLELLDCIVTNNEPLRDFMRELGVNTRVEVIPNGVDLDRFRPASSPDETQALRTRLGIGATDIMITTTGAITPRKGGDLLIEAWTTLAQQYPNTHIVLVGPRKDLEHPGLTAFRQRLEKLVEASGASKRIHFIGLCDNVESYYRASDIFVLPSKREGMPNSVLEAMASGIPVIVTPYIGLSMDIGEPGIQYLLADRGIDTLAATLKILLDDEARRHALGQSGLQWMRQTMSLEQSLDQYAALYHEMADSRI